MRKTASEYRNTWREKHPDGNREALAEFRLRHPEKVKAQKQRYYERHKEKIKAKNKAWREANRDRVNASERLATRAPHRREARRYQQWKRRYGLSPEQAKAMLASQNDACAICATVFAHSRFIHVDHCHDSLKVRGFLCLLCNAGLGSFRDNTDYLTAAVSYLRRCATSQAVC